MEGFPRPRPSDFGQRPTSRRRSHRLRPQNASWKFKMASGRVSVVWASALAAFLVAAPFDSGSSSPGSSALPCEHASPKDTYCSHLNFGPLRLLESGKSVMTLLGAGTQGTYCYRSNAEICDRIWKYTDGKVLVLLDMGIRSIDNRRYDPTNAALVNISITVDASISGVARFRAGVPPVGEWRWEKIRVLSPPPFHVPGWNTCGWDPKLSLAVEFCGGNEPDPRSLVVSYSYRNREVRRVNFGTE